MANIQAAYTKTISQAVNKLIEVEGGSLFTILPWIYFQGDTYVDRTSRGPKEVGNIATLDDLIEFDSLSYYNRITRPSPLGKALRLSADELARLGDASFLSIKLQELSDAYNYSLDKRLLDALIAPVFTTDGQTIPWPQASLYIPSNNTLYGKVAGETWFQPAMVSAAMNRLLESGYRQEDILCICSHTSLRNLMRSDLVNSILTSNTKAQQNYDLQSWGGVNILPIPSEYFPPNPVEANAKLVFFVATSQIGFYSNMPSSAERAKVSMYEDPSRWEAYILKAIGMVSCMRRQENAVIACGVIDSDSGFIPPLPPRLFSLPAPQAVAQSTPDSTASTVPGTVPSTVPSTSNGTNSTTTGTVSTTNSTASTTNSTASTTNSTASTTTGTNGSSGSASNSSSK
jgi:hypothetical protein